MILSSVFRQPQIAWTFVALLIGAFAWRVSPPPQITAARECADEATGERALDAILQNMAHAALGPREGTIIVMDAQSGRVRASVNDPVAIRQSFAPGSTVKLFTALAAMRSGLLRTDSQALCRTNYSRDGFRIKCSHPRSRVPFDTSEALAHSCNYYFARIGERLDAHDYRQMLAVFGFGSRTGVRKDGPAEESTGDLFDESDWRTQDALGEGPRVLVTPLQLLTASTALVNGGRLLTPYFTLSINHQENLRAKITITEEHRATIIRGMRGAVVDGTAANSGLRRIPRYIFGKTGTSTAINDFRSQGWFVGYMADEATTGEVIPEPDRVELAVTVFLKHAHGAQAAAASQSIFEAYDKGRRTTKTPNCVPSKTL